MSCCTSSAKNIHVHVLQICKLPKPNSFDSPKIKKWCHVYLFVCPSMHHNSSGPRTEKHKSQERNIIYDNKIQVENQGCPSRTQNVMIVACACWSDPHLESATYADSEVELSSSSVLPHATLAWTKAPSLSETSRTSFILLISASRRAFLSS